MENRATIFHSNSHEEEREREMRVGAEGSACQSERMVRKGRSWDKCGGAKGEK